MKIMLDGEVVDIGQQTILELAVHKNIELNSVAVIYNGYSIPTEICKNTIIKEADQIEFVNFIVGG